MSKIQWADNWLVSILTVALQIVLYWGLTGENPGPVVMLIWLVINMFIGTAVDYVTNR